MKIKNSTELREYIDYLLLTKEDNMLSAEIYIDYLSNNYCALIDEGESEKNIFNNFVDVLSLNLCDEGTNYLVRKNKIDVFKKLTVDDYVNDPYYQNVNSVSFSQGGIVLKKETYPAYLAFVYDDLIIDIDDGYREITLMGYFTKDFSYLSLSKDDIVWMSVIPHEINTMRRPISSAKGKVLVLGLGLGYYAYMIAKKENVETITIIENDIDVIEVFQKAIFPQFSKSMQSKIAIVNDDAYAYLAKSNNIYDEIFVDIYHNASDGIIHYFKIKSLLKNSKSQSHLSFWIETSLLALFRRQMLTLIEEQINGYDENDYKKERNINDKIINRLYWQTKNLEIMSKEQLKKFLSDENLKKLAEDVL